MAFAGPRTERGLLVALWAACGCQAYIPLWSLQRNCPKSKKLETILDAGREGKRLEGKEKLNQGRWQTCARRCFVLGRNETWA